LHPLNLSALVAMSKQAGEGENGNAESEADGASTRPSSTKGCDDALLLAPPEKRILTMAAQSLLDNASHDLPLANWEGTTLNCGLPWWLVGRIVGFEKSLPKTILALISAAVLPLEIPFLWLVKRIPGKLMNKIFVVGFKLLIKLCSRLPVFITHRGINTNMSIEAHLMSVFMWPSRVFPMTLRRVRFGMSNLDWLIPPALDGAKEELIELPERGVRGIWLHTAPTGVKDPPVFVWVFGGAFFAGDMEGNRGIAAHYARQLGADAFVVHYRLLPENRMAEALRDGARAYEYVLSRKSPDKIIVGGVSAGGGLLLNALQCARSTDPEIRKWAFHGTDPTPQPAAAMLIAPYVDFTIPVTPAASLLKNAATDLVVTQRVLELAAPMFLSGEGSQERLRGLSPLYRDLSGLCPIHVSYSLREALTDMCSDLVKKLQAEGNEVDTFTTPYLGHVFQVLSSFLPEAMEAEKSAVCFMRKYLAAREPCQHA